MKHTIKLLTLAAILTAVFGLTGCPGPVNNYIEPVVVPEYTITVNVTHGTAEYPATAKAGETVTITATADEGYILDNANSAFSIPDYSVTNNGTVITWNLVMPASNVTINVVFKAVEDNTTVDDETTEPTDETPTEEIPTDTEGNGDTEEDTPVVDNGDEEGETEGDETDNGSGETPYTPVYDDAGGCDDPECPEGLRYKYTAYQIYAYVYSSVENALADKDKEVLYFSFPNDTTDISQIVTINDYLTITIDNLVQMKEKDEYDGKTVKYFAYDNPTLLENIGNSKTYSSEEPELLTDLDNNSPIYIVIE